MVFCILKIRPKKDKTNNIWNSTNICSTEKKNSIPLNVSVS